MKPKYAPLSALNSIYLITVTAYIEWNQIIVVTAYRMKPKYAPANALNSIYLIIVTAYRGCIYNETKVYTC